MVVEKLEQEAAEYFKTSRGFDRAFMQIRNKYRSLGKIGGTIQLRNLRKEEKDALSGFLGRDYYSKTNTSIKIEKFQEALNHTRFSGVNLEDVLNIYFQENLISKKEEQQLYTNKRESFFSEILQILKGTIAHKWISYMLDSKDNGYKVIINRYGINKKELRKNLLSAGRGLNTLPMLAQNKQRQRLAIFASTISKNPHAFDEATDAGKLLLYGISYLLEKDYPKSAEEKNEYYYKVGIIKDEISNFTICSGLLAYRNGQLSRGWEEYLHSSEPMHVSLWNLNSLDRVISPHKRIFVFENPTVFSEVLYRTGGFKPSLMCTYGQVKLASLVLLDMLTDQGTHIYYSGDFDPEGLQIADKLKKRYGNNLTLLRYTEEDYAKSLSNEQIGQTRINIIDKLEDQTLKNIGQIIQHNGLAGYQEALVGELIDDILGYLG